MARGRSLGLPPAGQGRPALPGEGRGVRRKFRPLALLCEGFVALGKVVDMEECSPCGGLGGLAYENSVERDGITYG